MTYTNSYLKQSGLSLIEILVSLLLGTMLMMMSFHLYYSTKKSEQVTTEVMNTQAEARNAMHLVRQAIEHAGYMTDVERSQYKSQVFSENDQFAAGQVIRIDGTNTNQKLMVRLQGDDQKALRACNGDIITPEKTTTATETWIAIYRENQHLMCQVYVNGVAAGDKVVIADSVVAMKLRAFEETDSKKIKPVVANGISKDLVQSVQVQLVLRSEHKIKSENETTTIALTGFNTLSFNDQYYYTNTNQYLLAQNR